MTEDKKPISKVRPGDKVLRKPMQSRRRLRVAPNVPGTIKVLQFLLKQTPFLPMFSFFVFCWLVFSAFFFLAEHNVNPNIPNYGQALWWAMATVETMGTPYKPLSTAGEVIGGIWAIFGVMLFWGTIIASVTAYFSKRKEGTIKQVVATLEYNLEHLDELSIDELTLLRDTLTTVINEQAEITKARAQESQGR